MGMSRDSSPPPAVLGGIHGGTIRSRVGDSRHRGSVDKTRRPDVSAVGPKLDGLSGVKPGLSSKTAELIKAPREVGQSIRFAWTSAETPRSESTVVAKRVIGRECGKCSLCCRLLNVPEINKPEDVWCHHCHPGRGCRIYDQRPDVCRGYKCLWLIDSEFDDRWFPAKSKIIVDLSIENGKAFLRFTVDPHYPNRWREEPYYSTIKKYALQGLRGELLRTGEQCLTIIVLKGKRTLILPHKEISYHQPGLILPVGDDRFEFLPCNEEVARLTKFLSVTERAAKRAVRAHPEIARQNPLALLDVIAQDPEIVALTAKETEGQT